ncbi:hypothetical protein [Actinomadura violacea]|uniref:Uncharacterized protein n=1 Tax=Actinomadura violacea TaxID=2819934 RepID=A0ABS3S4V1_9ACTN|nr:hypothetical protein [Actinomadura violacea]MBO2463911.1 hypothetical protein [Actinomadura violacea]
MNARPLWSARDWEAGQVRVVLRAGFSVESHDPLTVGICDDFTDLARQPAGRHETR